MHRHPLLPATLVALILLVAPWPQGAVEPLWSAPVEWAAAALLLLYAWQPERVLGPVSRPLRWLGLGVVGLLVLGLLQVVPLGDLLATVSPATHAHTAPYVPGGLRGPGTISLYPYPTRVVVCMWAAAAAICLTTARACRDPRASRRVAQALVGAALAVSTVGLGYYAAGGSLPWVDAWASARMVGSYRNPNHYAGLLVLALPCCLAFAGIGEPAPRGPDRRRGPDDPPRSRDASRAAPASDARRRLLWLAPAGLLLACVVLTRSRGGALATLVALGLYLVLTTPGRLREIPRGLLAGAVAAALFLLTLGLNPLAERFSQATDELGKDVSRLAFTREALRIGAEFPLLGAGLRSQAQLTPARVPASKLVNATHNDYANLWADGGLLGVACLAAILIGFGVLVRRGPARAAARPLWAACLAGVAGHLLWAGAEFNLQIPANLWAFAAVAGLALGLSARDVARRPLPDWLRVTARVGLGLGALALLVTPARMAWSDWVLRQDDAVHAPAAEADAEPGAEPAPVAAAVTSASLDRLRAAEAWDPENADLPRRRGMRLNEAGALADAVEPLRRACALEPRHALTHLHLARALLATQQHAAAARHLEQATALAPYFASRRLYAAQLWFWSHRETGDPQALRAGLANLQDTLRWSPNQVGAALKLLNVFVPDAGVPILAHVMPPEHPEVRRNFTRDLLARGRKLDAVRLLAPLATRDDADPDDRLLWAQVHMAVGGVKTALATYTEVVPALPAERRRRALNQALGLLQQAKRPQEAVALAQVVAAAGPRDPELQHTLGATLVIAGDPGAAADAFERAVNTGRLASGREWGRALLELGRARSAIEAWQRALPALTSRPGEYVSLTLELARLLRAEGRADDAQALVKQALRRFPRDERLRQAGG